MQPFSNEGTGVVTIMEQKLILLTEESVEINDPDVEISQRVDLNFDHTLQSKVTQGELKISRDLIKKLCRRNRNDDHLDLSDIFSKFIRSLRLLSYPAFSALYGHSRATCPTGRYVFFQHLKKNHEQLFIISSRKHLLDILPFVNTAASVAVMKDIILKEKVPESTVNEWVLSMAFITYPDENMLEVTMNLLEKHKFSPVIALSVSSLTHSYCIHHSNCQDTDAVSSILRYLEDHFLKLMKTNYRNRETYDEASIFFKCTFFIFINL